MSDHDPVDRWLSIGIAVGVALLVLCLAVAIVRGDDMFSIRIRTGDAATCEETGQ